MKLLGSSENKTTKDRNGKNVPPLEITKVVLVLCNIDNNDYQQNSRVLYTFIPNKRLGGLLEIAPTNCSFLKTFSSEFSYFEVWFADENSQLLETEDKKN